MITASHVQVYRPKHCQFHSFSHSLGLYQLFLHQYHIGEHSVIIVSDGEELLIRSAEINNYIQWQGSYKATQPKSMIKCYSV
jgi:hypothetical protein